jgi:hypothetical protein
MSLKDVLRLFSLETLDTRFFVPATTPVKEALEDAALDPAKPLPVQNGRTKGKGSEGNIQPSRWNTPEFYFYYFVHIVCVPLMFKAVYDVSKGL